MLRLAHPQEGLGLRHERNGAFAGLLAIDVATDHDFALLAGGIAVVNFAERVFVDVADGFFQEVAKEHVAVRVDEHAAQADIAIAFVAVQFEMAHVFSRRIAEIIVKAVERGIVANDAITFVAEGANFVEHTAEVLLVLHPEWIAGFADVGLEIDLDRSVFAEVANEVGEAAIVLLHDRRLDDDGDAGFDAEFFGGEIFDGLEGALGAVLEGAQRFVDLLIDRFERDVDVKRIVRKDALNIVLGEAERVRGEAEIDAELLGVFEGFVKRLENGGLAAAQGNVIAGAGEFFGLLDDGEHLLAGKHRFDFAPDGAEGAGEIAAAAEDDVVGRRRRENAAGLERKAAAEFFLEVRDALDDLFGNADGFGHIKMEHCARFC
jgi:hypothetical protein